MIKICFFEIGGAQIHSLLSTNPSLEVLQTMYQQVLSAIDHYSNLLFTIVFNVES